MRSLRVLAGPLLGAGVALAAFLVLYLNPSLDPRLAAPRFHFWLVSGTSVLAWVLAMAVAVVGVRAHDPRVLYLGAGLSGLAGFFALHGLATPGFVVQTGALVGVSAQLSLVSLAGWMCAAAYPRPGGEGAGLLRTLGVWVSALIGAIVVGLARPEWARFVPIDRAPLYWFSTALVLVLLAVAGARFLEGYRLSRSGLHLVMLHVVGWLAATQVIMVLGDAFQLSWWLYHVLLLMAVVAMLVTLGRQMRAGHLDTGLRSLLSDDAERRLAYGLRPEVRALVVATEAKDRYTAGHMQRVAGDAVRLGSRVAFDPDDLRVVAQAGLIHDVGKIEIPDAVLNKPGSLTEDEFALIKSHPVAGETIARELGMPRGVLEVIRHHHERWDGGGYPDGRAGEAIPRLARAMAVVDVHDALTSQRAYRRPLKAEEALQFIEEGAGSAFDPAFARAWVDLVRPSLERPAETEATWPE